MRRIVLISVLSIAGLVFGTKSMAQTETKAKTGLFKKKSPRKEALGIIGGDTVRVDYGSPKVKGRVVWGGLEDYDVVWRAGANATTSITFKKDVMINGKELLAGKYAFFVIPSKDKDWVVIFNKEWSRKEHKAWGAFNYHQEKDVLRLNIKPVWVNEIQEELLFEVKDNVIQLSWEKLRLPMVVEAK